MIYRFILLFCLVFFSSCGVIRKKAESAPSPLVVKNSSPEEARAELREKGRDWLYGDGIGKSITNIGGVLIFPPYGIYLLGNSLLTLGGYENVYLTDALPDDKRQQWEQVYNQVVSFPGRMISRAAGKEYRAGNSPKDSGGDEEKKDITYSNLEELWHNSDL